MNEQELKIHRTWVQLLVDTGQKEAAAIAIDTEIFLTYKGNQSINDERGFFSHYGDSVTVELHFPTSVYGYIKSNDQLKEVVDQAMNNLLKNRTLDLEFQDGSNFHENRIKVEALTLVYHVKLIAVEDNWKETVRALIADSKGINNQGAVIVPAFMQQNKEPLLYKGLKFGSVSEIRIAQEFEQRKILFFPLAVGVRSETGQQYKDQREVDFLVCHNGVWGILEVSGPSHDGRLAKDVEKDIWFKAAGILCIEHRTAEQCYNNSKKVAEEFLTLLARHKR